jgi:hypothetical protein
MTAEQLNQAAALLGTTDKNVVISACIKTLVDAGLDIRTAYDAILGKGAYNKMASELHDSFNA